MYSFGAQGGTSNETYAYSGDSSAAAGPPADGSPARSPPAPAYLPPAAHYHHPHPTHGKYYACL